MTKFGIITWVDPYEPVHSMQSFAKQVEDLGFNSLWIWDTPLYTKDAYIALTLAALGTKKILLGPGVSNPVNRDVPTIVNTISTLDDLSGGRAILGFANGGHGAVKALGKTPPSFSQFKEALIRIQTLLQGKEVIVNDESGTHRVPSDRPINFRHVLSHTSGLDPSRNELTQEELKLLGRTDSLEETILQRGPLPLAFHPGDSWQYGSSTDYVALLVERIAGEPLKDYLQRMIFDPLMMEDTFYVVPQDKRHRVSNVYSPSGPGQTIELARTPEYSAEPFFGSDYYGGVAGLYSTASDYWRFSQMLLNGGELGGVRLLSPKTVNLMISNHSGDGEVYIRGPGYTFGLGFGIVSDAGQARDPLTPGTFSWGGAWGTIFWVDPVENMVGIMMTQITSYSHLTVRQELGVTAMQAIIDSYSNKPFSVRGYPVLD